MILFTVKCDEQAEITCVSSCCSEQDSTSNDEETPKNAAAASISAVDKAEVAAILCTDIVAEQGPMPAISGS